MPQGTLITLLAFLFVGGVVPCAPNPKHTLSLSITPATQTVKLGAEAKVEARLSNNSNRAITYSDSVPDCDLTLSVTDAKGTVQPETSYKRGLNCAGRMTMSREILVTLKPGEWREQEVLITKLYELGHLGTYFVQATRRVPSDVTPGLVKSNTVTVIVTE